jgi:hypothetical protein
MGIRNIIFLGILLVNFFGTGIALGQVTHTLANQVTYTSPNGQTSLLSYKKVTVENPNHALIENDQYARLWASPGLLLGLGAYEGIIELKFPSTLPANTTSYVRIGGDSGLLNSLVGGSLGNVLSGLLGGVLTGEQEIEIQARNGKTTVLQRSSSSGFTSDNARLVIDKTGAYFLAITPEANYDRVRIINRTTSLVEIGTEYNLDVFYAFYINEASYSPPTFTSFDSSGGINLGVISTSNQGVNQPGAAIDGDLKTFSDFSLGALDVSLAGSLSQFVYFGDKGEAIDELQLTFGLNPSLISLGLMNEVEIIAYNGTKQVYQKSLEDISTELLGLVQLDILGLLSSGEPVTIPIATGVEFDRLEIRVNTLAGLGAMSGSYFRLYEVSRSVSRPEFENPEDMHVVICQDETASFLPIAQPGVLYRWYDSPVGGNLLATSAPGELVEFGPLDAAEENYEYFVSAAREGYGGESSRTRVTVKVLEKPLPSQLHITPHGFSHTNEEGHFVYQEGSDPVALEPSYEGNLKGRFVWYLEDGQTLISDGDVVNDVSYSLDAAGLLTISGLQFRDVLDPYAYYLKFEPENGCSQESAKEAILEAKGFFLPLEITDFSCRNLPQMGNELEWSYEGKSEDWVFKVLRTDSSMEFKEIGILAYDNSQRDSFQFVDLFPMPGNNYYKIAATSQQQSGEWIYSSVMVVRKEEDPNSKAYKIFPNPATDHFVVQNIHADLDGLELSVLDQNGDEIIVKNLDKFFRGDKLKIEIPPLVPKGVYIIRMNHRNGIFQERIIIK